MSEVEQLRNQLAAAEARERELSEELSRKAISRVKAETVEPQLSLSSRNGVAQLHKSGASLGLMVGALRAKLSAPILIAHASRSCSARSHRLSRSPHIRTSPPPSPSRCPTTTP